MTENPEVAELRRRLDAAEREQTTRAAEANAAIAAAQDRSYWLDRWRLDLNGVMRTPAGRALNAALELLRSVFRRLRR
ncbi:MAG TPA: hypothetical protein VHR40_11690 [Thermoleophilaceae bacterium]|nr:hypothetical protein [Thermoleophilaceae bacterium]